MLGVGLSGGLFWVCLSDGFANPGCWLGFMVLITVLEFCGLVGAGFAGW